MRILFVLISVCWICSGVTFAQIDSLENLLVHQKGEQRAATLIKMALEVSTADTAKALGCAREALNISAELSRPDIEAGAYNAIGECFFYLQEYRDAISAYNKAIQLYLSVDRVEYLGEIYNSLGLSYYYLSEFDDAIASQIEAVKHSEKDSNLKNLTRIYINMGMVYNGLADYDSALGYYKKASVIAIKTSDKQRLGMSYNGIGTSYYNAAQLDSAKFYYRKALPLFEECSSDERCAAVINNLGNIYTDERDSLDVALSYYNKAYTIYEKSGNLRNKVFVMEGIGCAYFEMGNYEKALATLMEGVDIAIRNKHGYYIIQLYYEDIASVYEKKGMIKEAFSAYKTYKVYLDSMRQEERLFQATAIEKKYEFTKAEALISKLNSEKELALIQIEKDKDFRNLGIFAILILLGLVAYVSYSNFHRLRINKVLSENNIQIEEQRSELERLNASKNKFFSIIAHDIKNPLHAIMGYAYLLHHEYDRFTDKDKKKYLTDIYSATNNIFRLLQNLLDWSRIQTGMMNYEPVVFDISSLVDRICNLTKPIAEQKMIQLIYNVPGEILVYATPMMIETVLRNLVGNAVKFTSNEGIIKIGFSVNETDLSIIIEDNGIGMSEQEMGQLFSIESKMRKKGTDNEDGSGLGLILCKEFVQLNKGCIHVQSTPGEGTVFSFTVPLANGRANSNQPQA